MILTKKEILDILNAKNSEIIHYMVENELYNEITYSKNIFIPLRGKASNTQ